VQFKLITNDDPPVVIDAEQIWSQGKDGLKGLLARFGGEGEPAGDVLLAELARAARIWPRVERALENSTPTELELSTTEAYAFLRDFRPILMESGFVVLAPGWWGQPAICPQAVSAHASSSTRAMAPPASAGAPVPMAKAVTSDCTAW